MSDRKTYAEKLKDPRWQKRRLEILERDGWMCQSCFDDESTLVVHHRRYIVGQEPWEASDKLLITLCENCHQLERDMRPGYEDDLLAMLRENFYAEDIYSITNGFHLIQLQRDSHVTSSVIEWALSNTKIMGMLDNLYFEHLHDKHKKEAGNAKPDN